MIEFFIDTSTSIATIAILKDKKILNKKQIYSNNDLSNNLFKYIMELFKEVSIEPKQVSKIYASYGPGSFTGIRIGLTVAKTFAYSLGINVVPISSLQILASCTIANNVISIIDARRGYVFAGGYNKDLRNNFDDCYISLEELKNKYPDAIYVSYDKFNFDTIKPEINIEKVICANDNIGLESHKVNPNYLKITEAEANLKNA